MLRCCQVDFLAQQQKAQQQVDLDPYKGYFDASLVQVLEEMGFSTTRAHRGLFFTGNSSVEAAMEWIIGHSLDEEIDLPLDPEEVNSGKQSLPHLRARSLPPALPLSRSPALPLSRSPSVCLQKVSLEPTGHLVFEQTIFREQAHPIRVTSWFARCGPH